MYGREYEGREVHFEASGGLINSALVMRDKETDTYWSIMTGKALSGPLAGSELKEIPVAVKGKWKDWVREHPDTLVLSVQGVEDLSRNFYADYLVSGEGFRGTRAADRRLKTKTPIYALHLDGIPYAFPHRSVEGGKTFKVEGQHFLLYRSPRAEVLESTLAFHSSAGFEKRDGRWYERSTGAVLDPRTGRFEGAAEPSRLNGFDTFWYTWSLTNPETRLLR